MDNNIPPTTLDPAPSYGNPMSASIPGMSEKEFDKTINLAISSYGKEAQTQMLFEEMAELQDALCKLARGRSSKDNVCEEIADVIIMCLQMAQIYGIKRVEAWINRKMLRLAYNLKETKK